MYMSPIRFGPLAKIVPPAKPSAFDQAVHAKRDTHVSAVRNNAASQALAFLDAAPLDPAKPLGKTGQI